MKLTTQPNFNTRVYANLGCELTSVLSCIHSVDLEVRTRDQRSMNVWIGLSLTKYSTFMETDFSTVFDHEEVWICVTMRNWLQQFEIISITGFGLVFFVYPQVLQGLKIPQLWSVLFFLMLVTIGLGSQFTFVETILSGAQDELNRFGYLKSKMTKRIFR